MNSFYPLKVKSFFICTIIFIQVLFSILIPLSPVSAIASIDETSGSEVSNAPQVEVHLIKTGEDINFIAKKYSISVEKLRYLNQFNKYDIPFEELSVGDEIYVPKKMILSLKEDNDYVYLQEDIADTAIKLTNFRLENYASDKAKNYVVGQINDSISTWFNQFGTVEGQLTVDNSLSLTGSELDVLIPLYDEDNVLFYTQLGGRYLDDRATLNSGIGTRLFTQDDWMLGSNLFFDADITGKNQRIGLGIEAWRDYLKLSANQYIGITNWHQSRDFSDYNERPANGFDIRAEGYLPFYPQLGTKLIYETYQGNEVALFGKDERQKNPYAFTLGVNYTPFPLVSLGLDHQMGKSNKNDTSLNLQFNYQFGEDIKNQLSGLYVDNMRKLSQSRYDLVNRNNEIILDYKKQEVIKISLPESKIGNAGDTILVKANITSTYTLNDIFWDDSTFPTGGITSYPQDDSVEITLPYYNNNGDNTYQLKAKATDIKGNRSNTASMLIIVAPPSLESSLLTLTTDKNIALANNNDLIVATAKLTDSNGIPIARQTINFNVREANSSIEEGLTDTNGLLVTMISGSKVIDTKVYANLKSIPGKNAHTDVSFILDNTTISVNKLVVTQNNAAANGIATNRVEATVTDDTGNVAANQTITFGATNGATLVTSTVQTDAQGNASAELTNTVTGLSTVTATTNNTSKTVDTTFIADSATIKIDNLITTQDNAPANGIATNSVKATVTDGTGNAAANQTVTFSATNGATVITATVQTDAQGTASAKLTSTVAGQSTVTAGTNGTSKTVNTTFIVDSTTVKVDSLGITQDNAPANGLATNSVTATVTDATGNAASNQTVTFSATNGATMVTSTVQTDAQGNASAELTNTVTGLSTVTAGTNNTSKTADTTFITDSTTIKVDSLVITQDNAPANGLATNSVKATVTDGTGNVVANQTVTFSATNGAAVITATVQTDAQGNASTDLTSTIAGRSTVTAATNSTSKTVDTTFIVDSTTVKVDSLVITQDNAPANGLATNSVTATVTDATGNMASNQTVTFSATNGATMVTSTVQTDAQGTASAELTSTVAGLSKVTAGTNSTSKTADTSFITDSATVKVDSLVVTQDNAPANGISKNSVKATVTDGTGNPASNQAVTFSATNGATLITATVQTDAQGTAAAELTNTIAGLSAVTAGINNTSKTADTTFIPDSATVRIDSLVITQDNALANGIATNSVKATVTDGTGNIVANQTVTFSATNGATVVTVAVQTDAQGEAGTDITSYSWGKSTIKGSINSTDKEAEVMFRIDPQLIDIKLDIIKNGALGNGSDQNKILASVTARDQNGNAHPVEGEKIKFSSSNQGVTILTPEVLSDNNGQAEIAIISSTTKTKLITAILDSNNKSVNIEMSFSTGVKINLNKIEVAGNRQDIPDNSIFPDSAFEGATFKILHNSDGQFNSTLNWTSDNPYVTVSIYGVVTFQNKFRNNMRVTITASEIGNPVNYQSLVFSPTYWYIITAPGESMAENGYEQWCIDRSAKVAPINQLTAGNIFINIAKREFLSQWGALTYYPNIESKFAPIYIQKESGTESKNIRFDVRTGKITDAKPLSYGVICQAN
ncbi:Ig-like domain-containing protein [Morganella psychrotolerans]|uniref:Ig-like domain-containing protein n=1 Tax=Morganella psychrotolerans TaxID=368603 RepID=UPI0039AFE6E1